MTRAVPALGVALVLVLAGCGTSSSPSSTASVPETSTWPSTLTPGPDASPEPSSSSTSASGTSASSSTSSSSSSSSTSPSKVPSGTASKGEDSEWGGEAQVKAHAKRAAPAIKVASALADDMVKYRTSSRAKWWSEVKPALSTSGQQQMRSKPKEIRFTKVTGKARAIVTEADMGERYVSVGVPTDTGTYLFLAQREGKAWKIASISKMSGGQPDG